jgi:uncharacterized protein (TIGR00369 family)
MTSAPLQHYPGCFGCGSANHRGLGLRMTWQDGWGTAEYVVPQYGEGAPDIAHGGVVAALADETMALVSMAAATQPTMTAQLQIEYLRPTPSGRPLSIRGRVEQDSGRKMTVLVEGSDPHGNVCFRARGIAIKVATTRWLVTLQEAYRTEMIGVPVVLGLDLVDLSPGQWTIRATPDGITGQPGLDPEPTVVFHGPAELWHDLSRRRKDFDDVVTATDVRIDGDAAALRRMVGCLDFAGDAR